MEKYFKLTSESIVTAFGVKLFRLELTIDCKWGKKGDKGGWIESEFLNNGDARVSGDAWVSGDARVYGDAQVYGDARVYGDAQVYGDAWVSGDARVYGDAQVYGDAWDKSPTQIQGTKHFINVSRKGYIKIGCQEFEFSYWKKNFKDIGKQAGYSNSEIKEYGLYIELIIKLNK